MGVEAAGARLSGFPAVTKKVPVAGSALTIALAGNPNVGKSTLFNALTGQNQHTGNWPGKTVAVAEGVHRDRNALLRVVDLPGTYSLEGDSPEEQVAREFILGAGADAVVVLADATNLERNLYLILQIMELSDRVVVGLNMMDAAAAAGFEVDAGKLAELLGVPVVPLAAARGRGIGGLVAEAVAVASGVRTTAPQVDYGELNAAVGELAAAIEEVNKAEGVLEEARVSGRLVRYPSRWLAARLLEGDAGVEALFTGSEGKAVLAHAAALRKSFRTGTRLLLTRARYRQAETVAGAAVRCTGRRRTDLTARIDAVVTHRFWAFPVMAAVLAAVLWITMFGAEPFTALLEGLFDAAGRRLETFLLAVGAPAWLEGALVDGLVVGVGAVVSVMLPTMTIFFILFAVLEDAGFIPRLAFNLDRPLKAAGLQGKHCVTCLVGLGCNIPGVMACRIMSGKHRLVGILTNSLVPCNGRLGVMLPLALLFFGRNGPWVLFALFILSGAAVMFAGFVLSRLLPGADPGFVLELPPYRRPRFVALTSRVIRERVLHVLVRAVAVAAPMTLAVWFMSNYPGGGAERTITGRLAGIFDPVGRVVGLDGETLVALAYALPAKEIVIGALAVTSGLSTSLAGSGLLEGRLAAVWSPAAAFNFLLFYMLYSPCVYTACTIYQETRSLRYTLISILLPLGLAFLFTFVACRVELWLG